MSLFYRRLLSSKSGNDVPQTLVLNTISDQFVGNQPHKFMSLIQQTVTINWGDGSPDEVLSLEINTITPVPQHIYSETGSEWGLGVEKQVTFTFQDITYITLVDFRFSPFVGSFDSNIGNFIRLEQFRLVSITGSGANPAGFDFFPESVLALSNIEIIEFYFTFSNGSPAYYTMPLALFNKPLTGFRYGQTHQFTDKADSLTNFDKIGQYIDSESGELRQGLSQTLESLQLGTGLSIVDNLPSNLSTLQILNSLSIGFKINNDPTPLINGLTTIKNLSLKFDGTWGWGNFSQSFIENLTSLSYGYSRYPHAIVQVPDYFQYFQSNCTVRGQSIAGFNQQDTNNHLVSFALLADTYGNKITGNQLRGIIFQIDRNEPLIGEYRQPEGYVSGSDNGNPISALEWVWVLVNQYNWVVVYDSPLFWININSVPDTEVSNQPITSSLLLTETIPGAQFTYNWEQISGTGAIFSTPNSLNTDISGLPIGTHRFRLTVTNEDGIINYDEVSINIIADV
jgi:hypothetical protein